MFADICGHLWPMGILRHPLIFWFYAFYGSLPLYNNGSVDTITKVLQTIRPIIDLYFLYNLEAKLPQVSESRGMSGPRPSSDLKFFRFSSNYKLCFEIISVI